MTATDANTNSKKHPLKKWCTMSEHATPKCSSSDNLKFKCYSQILCEGSAEMFTFLDFGYFVLIVAKW